MAPKLPPTATVSLLKLCQNCIMTYLLAEATKCSISRILKNNKISLTDSGPGLGLAMRLGIFGSICGFLDALASLAFKLSLSK